MDKDKYECYTWPKQQTGFDLMVQSLVMYKGVGIGAAVGATGGAMKQKGQQRQQHQAAEQQAATYSKNREGYNRAQSSRLEGRGYSAK